MKIGFNRSSKKSSATKELEDLMKSLSNFKCLPQVFYSPKIFIYNDFGL
jgi:hypothetical protein